MYLPACISRIFAFGLAMALLAPLDSAMAKPVPVYSFTGKGGDGAFPRAGLTADPEGNLYGTTAGGGPEQVSGSCKQGCGIVFELTQSSGVWSETRPHTFMGGDSDGAFPFSAVFVDAAGNLFGTTTEGGGTGCGGTGCGTVFELTQSGGVWSETKLYSFTGSNGDGANPYSTLAVDSQGNLYGTTLYGGGIGCAGGLGCGTVFELVNNGTSYSEQVLHAFRGGANDGANPFAGVTIDTQGNLYGTTESGGVRDPRCFIGSCGTVFKLAPNGSAYTETILHSFCSQPKCADGFLALSSLAQNPQTGNLYGTTLYGGHAKPCFGYGCGTIFMLAPDGTYTRLYAFNGLTDGEAPEAGITFDANGTPYGTTCSSSCQAGGASKQCSKGCGGAYSLVNSNENEFATFNYNDGAFPTAPLYPLGGNFYGTTSNGGKNKCSVILGCGTVFMVTPP
jgi:uncharacterized repeat protein (TIGR03803 family)